MCVQFAVVSMSINSKFCFVFFSGLATMHLISTLVVLVAAMAAVSLAAPASESRDPAEPINLADVHLADDQVSSPTSNLLERSVRLVPLCCIPTK